MFEHSNAGGQRVTPSTLQTALRMLAIFGAIVLLAWLEWRVALH